MTEGEITAAHAATLDAFELIGTFFGGNIELIITVMGVVAVTGIFMFMLRAFFGAVGHRKGSF